jgi:hypothetical protein
MLGSVAKAWHRECESNNKSDYVCNSVRRSASEFRIVSGIGISSCISRCVRADHAERQGPQVVAIKREEVGRLKAAPRAARTESLEIRHHL